MCDPAPRPPDGQPLGAPDRLQALSASGLLDSGTDEAFDRLTRLVSQLLAAPVALFSLVDDHRQFFKSQQGLPEPVAAERTTPLSHSFCQHVATSGRPFVVPDARRHPLVRDNAAVGDFGVIAYAGMPVRDPQGYVLGSLCAIDQQPRDWTDAELATLRDLADAAMTEIALTSAVAEARQAAAAQAQTLDELRSSEARNAAIIEAALDGIVMLDADGTVVEFNSAAERMFGYRRDDALGRPFGELAVPTDRRAAHDEWMARNREGDPQLVDRLLEATLVRRDGTELPVEYFVTRVELDGKVMLSGHMRDVSERRDAARRIEHLALHDQLTGLPNRNGLERHFAACARRSDDAGTPLGLLLLDLDHFKHVNDGLGHAAGDDVVLQVSRRLRTVVGDDHLLARFGGDEFVVVAEGLGLPPERHAERLAARLLRALEDPFIADGCEVQIGASIGISLRSAEGRDLDALLRRADAAMYVVKRAGRGSYSTYRGGGDGEMALATAARLRRAVREDQLRLHYQPVQNLQLGRFVGVEALVRWEDPEHGLVGPGTFIPIAEETGLMGQIGDWVLERTCAQLVEWRSAGIDITVGFNVSPRQLRRADFVDRLRATVRRHGVDPSRLVMEVTEAVAMEETGLMERMLRRVRDLGVRIALDDFGAAYSSLSRLRHLPIDILKLDRQLLDGAPEDPGAVHVVRASIAMARGLGLEVVAEGVETRSQHDFLTAEGCPLAQGFFMARPMPPALVAGVLLQRAPLGAVAGAAAESERGPDRGVAAA